MAMVPAGSGSSGQSGADLAQSPGLQNAMRGSPDLMYMYHTLSIGKDSAMKVAALLPLDTAQADRARAQLGKDINQFDNMQKSIAQFFGMFPPFVQRVDVEAQQGLELLAEMLEMKKSAAEEVEASISDVKLAMVPAFASLQTEIDAKVAEHRQAEITAAISTATDLQNYQALLEFAAGKNAVLSQQDKQFVEQCKENQRQLQEAFGDMNARCEELAEEMKHEAKSAMEVKYLNEAKRGMENDIEAQKKILATALQDANDAVKDAAAKSKDESFGLFGITFHSKAVPSPTAEANAETLAAIAARNERKLGDATNRKEEANKLLGEAESEQVRSHKLVEGLETGYESAKKDWKIKAEKVEKQEKAKLALADKFPGLAPEAIIGLGNAIESMSRLSNEQNMSQAFTTRSTQLLADQQSRIKKLGDQAGTLTARNLAIKVVIFKANTSTQRNRATNE